MGSLYANGQIGQIAILPDWPDWDIPIWRQSGASLAPTNLPIWPNLAPVWRIAWLGSTILLRLSRWLLTSLSETKGMRLLTDCSSFQVDRLARSPDWPDCSSFQIDRLTDWPDCQIATLARLVLHHYSPDSQIRQIGQIGRFARLARLASLPDWSGG